jgi:hypothetical protein
LRNLSCGGRGRGSSAPFALVQFTIEERRCAIWTGRFLLRLRSTGADVTSRCVTQGGITLPMLSVCCRPDLTLSTSLQEGLMHRSPHFSIGVVMVVLMAACSGDGFSLTDPSDPSNWCRGTTGSNCGFPWAAITPREDSLTVGDTLRLRATYYDATDAVIPRVRFSWASGDTAIVTVDQSGLVYAVRPGWAFVVASANEPGGSGVRTAYSHLWISE